MSIECSECERDARGGHDVECSRFVPTQTHLRKQVERWVCETVEDVEEHVTWDVGFTVLPDPSTEGYVPLVGIYLQLAGPDAKGYSIGCPVLTPVQCNREFVTALVRDGIASLQEARATRENESKE